MSRGRQEDYDVYIARGADEELSVQVVDANGQAVDLTGATVTCQLRDPDGNLLADGTVTVADAEQGRVTVTFDSATTSGLPLGDALLDLRIVDSGGRVRYAPHRPRRAPLRVLVYDPATRA